MLRKFLRRLTWTIGIVVVLALLAHATAVVYTGWLLEGELAARREAGLPISFHDLATPRLFHGDNAAAQIELAVPWATGINQELYEVLDSPEYGEGRLSAEAAKQVAELAEVYERMCAPLRRAATLQQYQSAVLAQLPHTHAERSVIERALKHATDSRCVSRALRLRTMQLLENGQQDEAVDMLCLHLAIVRQLAKEPTLLSFLASGGCKGDATQILAKVIAEQPLTVEQRKRLDEELARHDDLSSAQANVQSEVVYSLSMLSDMSQGWFARPLGQYWQYQHLHFASVWSDALRQGSGSTVISSADAEPGFPLGLTIPAMKAFIRSVRSDIARTRCLRAMMALQATLAAKPNETPTIESLGLAPAAVRDLFAEGALRLKHTDAGWLIYSIGSDDVDNGGTFEKDADIGYLLPSRSDDPVHE